MKVTSTFLLLCLGAALVHDASACARAGRRLVGTTTTVIGGGGGANLCLDDGAGAQAGSTSVVNAFDMPGADYEGGFSNSFAGSDIFPGLYGAGKASSGTGSSTGNRCPDGTDNVDNCEQFTGTQAQSEVKGDFLDAYAQAGSIASSEAANRLGGAELKFSSALNFNVAVTSEEEDASAVGASSSIAGQSSRSFPLEKGLGNQMDLALPELFVNVEEINEGSQIMLDLPDFNRMTLPGFVLGISPIVPVG